MALPTLSVKDGAGATQTINTLPNAGQTTKSGSLPVTVASDQDALGVTNPVIGGATSDAAVSTDATGSMHQYLRGIVKLIVAKINIATVDTITSITNAVGITNALLGGATSDAAVSTDATGSIHQYLRGIVKLLVAKINIATVDTVTAVTTITNSVTTTNAVLGGATSDAAVSTDATGTAHQYLRGLVKLIVAKINIATVDAVTAITNALPAGTNLLGKVGIDQTTPGTTNRVDIGAALPAGTNAIGKLAANSGVDIGDVDVPTLMGKTAGQATMANSIPVAISSDQSAVSVKGTGISVTVTLTVTNGTYSIYDVVGGLITFANAVSANGKSAILNSITLAGVVAIPYELWFFNADIATPRADNAVFGLAAADGAICLGVVPITAADYFAAQTSFNNASVRGIGLQMQAGGATRSLYAYLKATAVTSPGTTTLYLTANFEYLD